MLKTKARNFIARILGWQIRRLYKKNDFTTVAVAGSIGKTSTKFAIANTLKSHKKVIFQEGNYNDLVSVPLVFFDLPMPAVFNPIGWLTTLVKIEAKLRKKYPYDVVIVEVGTDNPGRIIEFEAYLQIDITVLTAITPEHMEFFKDIDNVAKEELAITKFSKQLIINNDFFPDKYLKDINIPFTTFGKKKGSDYLVRGAEFDRDNAEFSIYKGNDKWISAKITAVAISEVYSATAASVVADKLGISSGDLTTSLARISPVSGRMQRLPGIKNSLILDETYNSSPEAVFAALDSLYQINAPQKIAILGNMNELGSVSAQSHQRVGEYCDPKQLDWVITIGPDANKITANYAKINGCQTKTFTNPVLAGQFVKSKIEQGAVILAKGSQNGVFAEEAVKQFLANNDDKSKLVRQSRSWMRKKDKQWHNASK